MIIRCTRRKSIVILTAAAIGGLVAGTTAKPAAASNLGGVLLHAVAMGNGSTTPAPIKECNGNGCHGNSPAAPAPSKAKNSCGGLNGCNSGSV
ncbi:MAG TPA: hypothetical protein VKJ65_12895 [Phycisphaerae bacterium]|nr:hypothetical protein [Phycisphaerae bacterium]